MGCGCRKNRTGSDARPAATVYEVYKNGVSTGRRFSTLGSAQSYADRVGGEIRAK